MFPIATGHTSKKKPPPVAPKPRASWTHTTLSSDTLFQLQEDPSSFSEVRMIQSCMDVHIIQYIEFILVYMSPHYIYT